MDGALAGCCALRPLDSSDYSNAAEMKRLYVRPTFRGLGLGRQLTEGILDAARKAGYSCVLLDTLDDMESARALYEDLALWRYRPTITTPSRVPITSKLISLEPLKKQKKGPKVPFFGPVAFNLWLVPAASPHR